MKEQENKNDMTAWLVTFLIVLMIGVFFFQKAVKVTREINQTKQMMKDLFFCKSYQSIEDQSNCAKLLKIKYHIK